MDLEKALAAHAEWKVKLRVAITEHQTLDADKLTSDCECEFGRWLHGDGRRAHSQSPSFGMCVEAHKGFHRAAGAVARAINAKDYAGADRQLGAGTPFTDASMSVAIAVRRLKRDMQIPA